MLYDLEISHMGTNAEQRKNDEFWLLKEVLGYNELEINKILKMDSQSVAINLTAEQVFKITPCFYNYDINMFAYKNGTEQVAYFKNIEGYNPNLYNKVKKSHYYDEPVIGVENRVDLTNPSKPIPVRTESIFPINVPKCPACGSSNASKIGIVNRMVSTGLFGLASSKIGKTHKCNNCGSTF